MKKVKELSYGRMAILTIAMILNCAIIMAWVNAERKLRAEEIEASYKNELGHESASAPEDPFDHFAWSNGAELTCFGNDFQGEKVRPLKDTGGEDGWWSNTPYVLELSLPEPTFADGSINHMRIYCPDMVQAEEHGTIVVQLQTGDGICYQTEYSFLAKDDFCLVYGDKNTNRDLGGELEASLDGTSVKIAFYASTSEHGVASKGQRVINTNTNGVVNMEFRRYDPLSELAS